MKPTISLVTFVKDEAANIRRMIESALPLVDEVCVLDTGSSDGTPDLVVRIAQENPGKRFVVDHCAFTNFGEIRTAAARLATMDWILMLDADEYIVEKDFPLFDGLASSGPDAFYLPRFNLMNAEILIDFEADGIDKGRFTTRPNVARECDHLLDYPDWQARFFKNKSEVFWVNAVHESMVGLNKISHAQGGPHIYHLHLIVKTKAERGERYALYSRLATGEGGADVY